MATITVILAVAVVAGILLRARLRNQPLKNVGAPAEEVLRFYESRSVSRSLDWHLGADYGVDRPGVFKP